MRRPALLAMEQPIWNFGQEPWTDERPDETSYNLRAHFDRMAEEKMREYSPAWTDETKLHGSDDTPDFREPTDYSALERCAGDSRVVPRLWSVGLHVAGEVDRFFFRHVD